MDDALVNSIRSLRDEFDIDEIYIFGSRARSKSHPESDIDILIVYDYQLDDPFELVFQIRRYLHERIDLALDVIAISKEQFVQRSGQPWAIEHIASTEGVAV
jgi:predicted nucleotidyltransferase